MNVKQAGRTSSALKRYHARILLAISRMKQLVATEKARVRSWIVQKVCYSGTTPIKSCAMTEIVLAAVSKCVAEMNRGATPSPVPVASSQGRMDISSSAADLDVAKSKIETLAANTSLLAIAWS
jgi:hypothetical protein